MTRKIFKAFPSIKIKKKNTWGAEEKPLSGADDHHRNNLSTPLFDTILANLSSGREEQSSASALGGSSASAGETTSLLSTCLEPDSGTSDKDSQRDPAVVL